LDLPHADDAFGRRQPTALQAGAAASKQRSLPKRQLNE
jgi:hypothetical protein